MSVQSARRVCMAPSRLWATCPAPAATTWFPSTPYASLKFSPLEHEHCRKVQNAAVIERAKGCSDRQIEMIIRKCNALVPDGRWRWHCWSTSKHSGHHCRPGVKNHRLTHFNTIKRIHPHNNWPSFGFVAPISVEVFVLSLHHIQTSSTDLACGRLHWHWLHHKTISCVPHLNAIHRSKLGCRWGLPWRYSPEDKELHTPSEKKQ